MFDMRLINADVVECYIKQHINALDNNAQHYSFEDVPVEAVKAVLRDILRKVQAQPEVGDKDEID